MIKKERGEKETPLISGSGEEKEAALWAKRALVIWEKKARSGLGEDTETPRIGGHMLGGREQRIAMYLSAILRVQKVWRKGCCGRRMLL